VTIAVGFVMLAMGVASIAGWKPRLPFQNRATTQRRDVVGMATFGFVYALVSLSCTLGPFLSVSAFAMQRSFVGGVATYIVYAAGLGTIILALSVSAALAHDSFVGTLRNASKYLRCRSQSADTIRADHPVRRRHSHRARHHRAGRRGVPVVPALQHRYPQHHDSGDRVDFAQHPARAAGLTRNHTSTMTRRADGTLETEVLRALWNLDRPAAPGDVIDEMRTDLAYTSIATVLGRLCDKGLAFRNRAGRAYEYEATRSEADLTVQRLRTVLDAASDRESALVGFAEALDPVEAAQLVALLKDTQ
jgi:predicted transcriptional regulator